MKGKIVAPKKLKTRFFGLNRIAPYIGRYKATTVTIIVATLAAGLLNIVAPLFQKYAIDNFIAGGTTDGLWVFALAYAAVVAAIAVVDYFGSYSCCRLEMYLLRDMRRAAFNHLQTMSVSYFNVNSVGKLHSRVMSDTSAIGGTVAWTLYGGVWDVVYIAGAAIVMFVLDPVLALVSLAVVPVTVALSMFFERKLTGINRKIREINSEITGGFNEGITGAETTKTLAAERRLDADFESKTAAMKKHGQRLGHYRALFVSLTAFAASAALAFVLWYGGVITADGAIKIGTLAVFMTYAQGIVEPVQELVEFVASMIGVKVNVERFTALVESESDVKDSPEVVEKYGDCFNEKRENWEQLYGDVEFDDVSFKYPDGGEYVLEHFNLKAPKGTNVAVVGETGAGKSTIINLVCRFFEPTEGRILIDGRDVRERSVQWLHGNIGYVLQTPHLFSGTVRENLLYGKEDATDEELWRAVESVEADGIIKRLEKGFDTEVGEGGNTLSAGEKQLLSFSRAILADPAILILDEATASVDTLTESLIQKAIEKIMVGRTCFVIAHRLSTVKNADTVIVVDDGKIVEQGAPAELLHSRGAYYNLYMRSLSGENINTV